MALPGRCDRTRSRVRAEQSRPPITKVKLPKERSFFAVNLTGRRAKPKAAHAQARARNQPCAHRQPPSYPPTRPHPACDTKPQTRQRREIETYEREKKKENETLQPNEENENGKAQNAAQRVARRCDASSDVGREKPKRRRKSRKFTKSYKMLHFIPCDDDDDDGE